MVSVLNFQQKMTRNNFKKLSIRKQLTLWYSLIIFLVAVILFSSFYLLTKRYLIYETDRSLLVHASQIAYNVALNTNSTQTKNILSFNQQEIPGMFVEIVDIQGFNTEGKSSNFKNLSAQAANGDSPAFTQQTIGDFKMRVIAYPLKNVGITSGSVVMGHTIEVYEKTLSQLKNIGIIVLFFLVAPSILIGYLLAKSATDPIIKLGMDISKITSENLSRRINLPVSSKETETLISNFNSLLDRLGKAFNLERQFLGEMAHEIKTPLSVMKSNSEVILSKIRSPKEYQVSITQTLTQIDKLSNNMISLMDFAWSQSTDLLKTFKEIDLSQLLSEINNVALYVASPKNIKIESDIKEGVLVFGKEEKLYQAIYNIVDNAVKFTPENGKVFIELSKKGGQAVIKITDNGIGIDMEQQKDIFNRFYRTEQNKNTAGHGLGLAITDSIIKAHGGSIKIESKKGLGSIFTILLRASS